MSLLTMAWFAILVVSNLTTIIWRLVFHQNAPLWSLGVRIGILTGLFVLAMTVSDLRPLRGYLLATIGLAVGLFLTDLVYLHGAVRAWIDAAPWRNAVIVSSTVKLITVAAMGITVIGMNRQNLYLAIGRLDALSRVPFSQGTVPWTTLGIILTVIFGASVAIFMTAALRPDFQQFQRAVALLPLIVFFAALNAFNEEFIFRSVLLGRLAPAVGGEQALWITSINFGLGHWFGNPRGPIGVVMATVAGLFWGKSMLETGGFFWAWLIHFIQDVVIFSFLIMSTTKS